MPSPPSVDVAYEDEVRKERGPGHHDPTGSS